MSSTTFPCANQRLTAGARPCGIRGSIATAVTASIYATTGGTMASERNDRKRRQVAWVEHAIDSAKRHGEDSEPDHEIGDLQELARAMWRAMDAPARSGVIRDFIAWAAPTCPRCDENPERTEESPLRMCHDADPTCMHCDVCDWSGDPTVLARPPTVRRGVPKQRPRARAPERPKIDPARERADMRVHLVLDDDEPTTLASFARNNPDLIDEPWADEGTLRDAIRSMEIGDKIQGGGGGGAEWRLVRVAKPTSGSGEEVTCDTEVTFRGRRLRIEVREGIASVLGETGQRIAAYTWQHALVDCIEGDGKIPSVGEVAIERAIKKAWAAEP